MTQLKNPRILFASDLRDGEVLFLGASGWTRDHRQASVARDSGAAVFLPEEGKEEVLVIYLLLSILPRQRLGRLQGVLGVQGELVNIHFYFLTLADFHKS